MRRKLQTILAAVSLFGGLAIVSASAQDKMSDSKMTHEQMMDKMKTISPEQKAAMIDKMTEKDKMAAMKMSGHDMSKMSSSDRMDMMGKMTTEDKAAMFDKMPMDKQMAMIKMMDSKKMDKDKMGGDKMGKDKMDK
jgi:hypothetical protein